MTNNYGCFERMGEIQNSLNGILLLMNLSWLEFAWGIWQCCQRVITETLITCSQSQSLAVCLSDWAFSFGLCQGDDDADDDVMKLF